MGRRSKWRSDFSRMFSIQSGSPFIHDISFNFEMNDTFTIYGGVNNIFNEKPFVTEQAYPVSPVGTFFFLGGKARF